MRSPSVSASTTTPREAVGQVGGAHDGGGTGVGGEGPVVVGCEARVDRHGHRPEPEGAEEGPDELDPVRGDDEHAVAGGDAEAGQHATTVRAAASCTSA